MIIARWAVVVLMSSSLLNAQVGLTKVLEFDRDALPFPTRVNSAGVYAICSFDVLDGTLFVSGYDNPRIYSASKHGWRAEEFLAAPGSDLSLKRTSTGVAVRQTAATQSTDPLASSLLKRAGRMTPIPERQVGVWRSDDGLAVTVRVPDRSRLQATARLGSTVRHVEVTFPDNLGYAECLGVDHLETWYFLADTYVQDVPLMVERSILVVGRDGDLRNVVRVPLGNQMTLQKEFVVDRTGTLYHLFADLDALTLFRWDGLSEPLSDTLRYPEALYDLPHRNFLLPAGDDATQGAAASLTMTGSRAQALDLAERYVYCTYVISPANLAPQGVFAPDGRHVTTPGWLVIGVNAHVPYKWGGFSSLEQFHAGIQNGLYAGDIDMATASSFAVGVDCSGFVSRCWGLSSHYGTARIPEISTAYASWDQILPGDAMNMAGYHVRLFVERTPNGGFLAAEAGPNGLVGYWVYPLGSLGGYVPCSRNDMPADCATGRPTLKSALLATDSTVLLRWSADTNNVEGYRVYASGDGAAWVVLLDESSVRTESVVVPLAGPTYFRVSRVIRDAGHTESAWSEILGASPGPVAARILIVDAFNDEMGAWQGPGHNFVFRYGRALQHIQRPFESVQSAELTSGRASLGGRSAVIWFTGGDGLYGESISTAEQDLLGSYLESGGCLFVNGGDIGYDLGLLGSSADNAFYAQYLKAFPGGDQSGAKLAEGASGSLFAGQVVRFGQYYLETYPDVVDAAGGSTVCFSYPSGAAAGIQFAGAFGTSSLGGVLVHLGFPVESIADDGSFNALVAAVVRHFDASTNLLLGTCETPQSYSLDQNYPNPFNPETKIGYRIKERGYVEVSVMNILGQRVAVLVDEEKEAGYHEAVLSREYGVERLPSGIYFYRLVVASESGERFESVRKMILMK